MGPPTSLNATKRCITLLMSCGVYSYTAHQNQGLFRSNFRPPFLRAAIRLKKSHPNKLSQESPKSPINNRTIPAQKVERMHRSNHAQLGILTLSKPMHTLCRFLDAEPLEHFARIHVLGINANKPAGRPNHNAPNPQTPYRHDRTCHTPQVHLEIFPLPAALLSLRFSTRFIRTMVGAVSSQG